MANDNETTDTVDWYMIWSNEHRGWWRVGSRGYSPGLSDAGMYSREAAIQICREAIPSAMHVGVVAEIPVRVADVREFLAGQVLPVSIVRDSR